MNLDNEARKFAFTILAVRRMLVYVHCYWPKFFNYSHSLSFEISSESIAGISWPETLMNNLSET